jgi:hypothetical protein
MRSVTPTMDPVTTPKGRRLRERQGHLKRLPLKAARLGAAGDCGYTPAGAGKARVMAAVRFETFSRV